MTERERFQQAREVFEAAADLAPPQRQELLAERCGNDDALRAEVERLLAADDDPHDGLRTPVLGHTPATQAEFRSGSRPMPTDNLVGSTIGPYTLTAILGEGGFGTVYAAEQQSPVKRQVAFKLIKLGMNTREVVERFELERQALAVMEHPNIAKVLDAGTTADGRPYFVMELVRGTPIAQFCDENKLPIGTRLELFRDVCAAVQHAHQKGVIHRDIKPSNVLVGMTDGSPQPRIIDFGIAKAIHGSLHIDTTRTQAGERFGTPAYMSPEQVRGDRDLDTRTDVYALGVLLYELLTGTTPYDTRRLAVGSFAEIQRMILEESPPRPSARLSERGAQIDAVAERRGCDVRKLRTQLRGELEWIVLKALEKDRARRYETASGFAADIDRYLNDEPVVAGPPSASYRMRKFMKRHRGGVTAAALVALALVLGMIVSTFQYLKAESARADAVAARVASDADREAAELSRDDAESVVEFLSEMLAAVDPGVDGKDVRVRQILDEASGTVTDAFVDQPLIEARLRNVIGHSYLSLGFLDEADGHISASVAIRQRELGPNHLDTLLSTSSLGQLLTARGRLEEAEATHRHAYETRLQVLGEEHHRTQASMNSLAGVLRRQGKNADAERVFRQALEIRLRVLGEEHPHTLGTLTNLASTIRVQGRYAEAEELYRRLLEAQRRVLGAEHPQTLITMNNLAGALGRQGRNAEAEPLFRETLEIRRRVFGDEHPRTLMTMMSLAVALKEQSHHQEAAKVFRETLEIRRRVLGEEHPHTLGCAIGLAETLFALGDLDKAEHILRETIEVAPERYMAYLLARLGEVLIASGNPGEAKQFIEEGLAQQREELSEDHSDVAASRSLLGECLMALGQYAEAEPLLLDSYDRLAAIQSESGPETTKTLHRIIKLYEARQAAEPGNGYDAKAAEWRAKMPNDAGSS